MYLQDTKHKKRKYTKLSSAPFHDLQPPRSELRTKYKLQYLPVTWDLPTAAKVNRSCI